MSVEMRERQQVPRRLRGALYMLLLTAGALGVFALDGYSPLPTTALLDGWIILLIVAASSRAGLGHQAPLLLIAGYGATRAFPALSNGSPPEDFLQAYRWLLYLIAFVVTTGMTWGPLRSLRRVVLLLVAMALIKGGLSFAVVGAGERPGLLIENNFEIALFCGLVLVTWRQMPTTQRFGVLTMLAGLVVLAGSRSGAVSFAILVLFVLAQTRTTTANKVVAGAYALPAIAAIPAFVFAERAEGGGRIDRLNFFEVFQGETSNWSALNWLFGTEPITALSASACGTLSYYENLFSSAGDGSCYSVILHAFALRVVFDAGLLGLALAFAVPWLAMRSAQVPRSAAVAVLAIAGANSLSVSGLNNPYVALPIIFAILLADNALLASDDGAGSGARSAKLAGRNRGSL